MLLAKSSPRIGLRQHTEDVLLAVNELRLIWPEIPPEIVRAAIFHDLGKAAIGFQQMLQGEEENWKFRHEVLSAEIFRQCRVDDLAYLAVLTHHKNLGTAHEVSGTFRSCCSETRYAKWFEKWRELLANISELKGEMAGLDPEFDKWEPIQEASSPANDAGRLILKIQPVFIDMAPVLGRGALVAADHIASSGLRSVGQGRNISREALERYAAERISRWTKWSDLQRKAGAQLGSAMLVAPTGAGKTEASLLWAIANRKASERIFYVLPYQVSINAMAERIAGAFPDQDGRTEISTNNNVAILHSNMDLAYLQDALGDDLLRQEAVKIALRRSDAARKIYAPIKVATVFQLLDIFFGRKFFEVGLLELTNSIVVFDEIHAYDGHTLGLIFVLLECLQKLGARILIMTATLPVSLKVRLCHYAGIEPNNEILLGEGDPLLSEVRRSVVVHNCCIEQMVDSIYQSVRAGKKTAVVCNTVAKAIAMYRRLADLQPLLVHSRFTLGDRAKREKKEHIENEVLVVATQVIEVSLDVSFDAMFTELAPADSLLQRFGRVNRHGKQHSASGPALCHILQGNDAGSERVYSPELLAVTSKHIPTEPLTFATACDWVDAVYPHGLTERESIQLNASEETFRAVVARLKPMLDSEVAESTEKTLVDSVQVIPVEMEPEWQEARRDKNYMEAKKFLVNVSRSSWFSALRKSSIRTPGINDGWIIAPFKYDTNQGLLLDQPRAS